MCCTQVLTMVLTFAFAGTLPTLFKEWELTNTEAGWVSGIYYIGYCFAIPFLVSLTDHIDAKPIYIVSAGLNCLSAAGFAIFAEGLWTALLFQCVAGIGLAGTFLPGLRIMVDRYDGSKQSRVVSFYASSFSLGVAGSYFITGIVNDLYGWRAVFTAASLSALIAIFIVTTLISPVQVKKCNSKTQYPNFLLVLENRRAIKYMSLYFFHCWELFAVRSWVVTFLAFCFTIDSNENKIFAPTTVAMLASLVAAISTIIGNEIGNKYGQLRVITWVMLLTAAVAVFTGFITIFPYVVVVVYVLIYSMLIQADSALLTAGVVGVAEPGKQGTTFAMFGIIGFIGAFLGSLVFGVILDLFGGINSILAWQRAFISLALVGLVGQLTLRIFDKIDTTREVT